MRAGTHDSGNNKRNGNERGEERSRKGAANHILASMTLRVTVPKAPYLNWHWRGGEAKRARGAYLMPVNNGGRYAIYPKSSGERRYAATVRWRGSGACAGGREYGGERASEARKQWRRRRSSIFGQGYRYALRDQDAFCLAVRGSLQ
jgi:hypothetical protein